MPRDASGDASWRNGENTVQELRKTKRYQLNAPVRFSWEGSDGQSQMFEGVTRDISMRGVFVLSAALPQVAACLELDVYMPAVSARGRAVKLHGEGRAIRIEPQLREGRGFAAEIFFESEPQSGERILNLQDAQ